MIPIETWAFGYALVRGYRPPEPVPVGLWMEVGKVEQRGRFVLRHFDLMMFGNLVRSIDTSGVYIEAFAPREAVVPRLPENWIVRERAYLMVTELTAPATLPVTSSYEPVAIDEGAMIRVEVRDEHGDLAASGCCALVDGAGVFDQILTQEAHRRRGLGTMVMNALTRRALERGARGGVLIATPDGRALYRTLGWSEWSEVTSVISPGN
jgi:GNAT superfamily N-acetyltransferase